MASVIYIIDEATRLLIDDPDRLAKIKQLLRYVLKEARDRRGVQIAISTGVTHTERRLHQMLYDDCDYDINDRNKQETATYRSRPVVTVKNCMEKGYSVVYVRCKDRPKLLFNTVCTLTDMQYVVFRATVNAEDQEANQEYYIRHIDGCPVCSEAERECIIHCLEAAIGRRSSEGLKLELCCEDRVGLLSDVTRIFRENGLSVSQAEVTTQGSQALNMFYVTDAMGNPVNSQTVEAVRREVGQTILHSKSQPQESSRFSLGNLFRSRSQKLPYNLGLIRSYSS